IRSALGLTEERATAYPRSLTPTRNSALEVLFPMAWIPVLPTLKRNFPSFIQLFTPSKKPSSEKRQPTDADGKKPNLLSLPNREDPSVLRLTSAKYFP